MNQSMSHATLSLIIFNLLHRTLLPSRPASRPVWKNSLVFHVFLLFKKGSGGSSGFVPTLPLSPSPQTHMTHENLKFHEIFMRFSCSSVYASQGPKSSVCIASVVSIVSIAPVSNRNREGSAACQKDKKIHILRILTCLICIFFHSGHGVSFCGINAHTSTWK